MQEERNDVVFPSRRRSWPWVLLFVLLALLGLNALFKWTPWPWSDGKPRMEELEKVAAAPTVPPPAPPSTAKIVDFEQIEKKTTAVLKEKLARQLGITDQRQLDLADKVLKLEPLLGGANLSDQDLRARLDAGKKELGLKNEADIELALKVLKFKAAESTETAAAKLAAERKGAHGLDKSVDMVVTADETIKVGRETVPLKEILAEIDHQGEVVKSLPEIRPGFNPPPKPTILEEELTSQPSPAAPAPAPAPPTSQVGKVVDYYGVYVVRPGDNLWDIHFAFLREYMHHRGIAVGKYDDEWRQGKSTGVARVLKWAEGMVKIFNLRTRKLDKDLSMLAPREKVVIFNLSQLGRILGAVNPDEINEIKFDGVNIYLPGEKKPDKRTN
ncbi:MAG: hypothetical protein V1816_22040 [Pseudomonadota bacterium]